MMPVRAKSDMQHNTSWFSLAGVRQKKSENTW